LHAELRIQKHIEGAVVIVLYERRSTMRRNLLVVVLLLCSGIQDALGAEALKKIRIASKAAGESLVPYVIPQRLGFYREEGRTLMSS
jgi:hypothetical protein